MRLGFLAGSITAHAAVVCLAWRLAPLGERAAAPPSSGLPSHEVEVAWDAQQDPPNPAAEPERAPAEREPAAEPTQPNPPVVARPPAAVVAARTPRASAPRVVSVETADHAAPSSRANEPTKSTAKSAPDDWLSEAQQLPDSEATSPATASAKPAPRDALVERLLAKERDRERLAARDEAERRAEAAAREAQSGASPPAQAPTVPAVDADAETFGESRAHADLWVELTRWLPRAASNDQSWERLPSNASYEFRIELITEGGKLVDSKVLDSAPAPTAKLLTATSHLMGHGHFGGPRRVSHRFELRIRLSTTEPRDLWIAHTTPDPPKPGVGSFIAPSGRRFDVWVSEVK